jgi:hypothetical protein
MTIIFIYKKFRWIDGSMRIAKGWVPSHCVNFKERAAFTFGNAKVGRGDRLVVLAASKVN